MRRWIGVLFLLSIGLAIVLLRLIPQRLIFRQRATVDSCSVLVNTATGERMTRNWENYAQGGEENTLMLQPVSEQIQTLKPKYIRIDHFFDYSNRDLRLLEIKRLGALPFISLSYFPGAISDEPTKMPADLTAWTDLVRQAAENISRQFVNQTVYFEVWNEPDLFGGFTPEQYYQLYLATAEGIRQCRNCTNYKIGGPAITTIKIAWLDRFLDLVNNNNTRLDFVSWHSYQKDPRKTIGEKEKLINISSFQKLKIPPELIVSEWGITPENSYLNDGYESASHTVAVVGETVNQIDKLFAFELKDGPDPQGKQFWGRWGLLTHQNANSLPKPRYYAFLLLNRLGNYRLPTNNPGPDIYSITTLEYPANYSNLLATINTACRHVQLNFRALLNGVYEINTYSLDPLHNPVKPVSQTMTVNQPNTTIAVPVAGNGVYLITLNRQTAGSFKGQGKGGVTNDFSARIGPNTPGIDYPVISLPETITSLEVGFSFKGLGKTEDTQINFRRIVSSINPGGFGFEMGVEKLNDGLKQLTVIRYLPGNREEKYVMDVTPTDLGQWHNYRLSVDNTVNSLSFAMDDQSYSASYTNPWPVELGDRISFGDTVNPAKSIEGFLDDVVIKIPGVAQLQDNFNPTY